MKTFLLYPTEEQESMLHAFLETNNISFVKDDEKELPLYVIERIARGKADIKAGRFVTFEEFTKKFPTK